MFRRTDVYFIIGFILMVIGIAYGFYSGMVHGSNSTNSTLTLGCLRMFYSDQWNQGYVTDLAKYCNEIS